MTRKKMIEFLEEHFRYDTMNSWNAATSYAANVKVNRAITDKSISESKYDFLNCEESFDDIHFIINQFDIKYNHRYQIGFNGRSGGYLVLYQGGVHDDGVPFNYPGRGMDMNEDFNEWLTDELKDRVKLVKDFDEAVEDCVFAYVNFCKAHIPVEETRYKPYKVMVAEKN